MMTKILLYFLYAVFQQPDSERLYQNHEIEIWAAWPNPASTSVTLAFQFKVQHPISRYELRLSNVLGSELLRHRLLASETEIKISLEGFKPGIYFYTLVEDFRHVATRKLIIR